MTYLGIFLVILILFVVPLEIVLTVAVLAAVIYFWHVALIIALVALGLFICYWVIKTLFKGIGAVFSNINSFLDGEESATRRKNDVNMSQKRKDIANEIMEQWNRK